MLLHCVYNLLQWGCSINNNLIQQKMNALTYKISTLPVELLKQICNKLNEDLSGGQAGQIVFENVLNALEEQMEESEFIAFCDSL